MIGRTIGRGTRWPVHGWVIRPRGRIVPTRAGFPSALVHARAHELGATVLAKPFSTATLHRLVGELLGRGDEKVSSPLPT